MAPHPAGSHPVSFPPSGSSRAIKSSVGPQTCTHTYQTTLRTGRVRRGAVAETRYPRGLPNEGFFLTVAGLAMSFAGFTGLMNALRRQGETWEPMELYQLRIIVAYSIT